MRTLIIASALLTAAAPVAAQTATNTTTTITTLDGSQGVSAPAGELRNGSSATITDNTALSEDGSLLLSGERTRVLNGNNYSPTTNYGAANDLVSLTGDYIVLNGGNGGIQSPAFRVYIQDGSQRSELIYEAAYNGGYTLGQPHSVNANSLFYQYIAPTGPTYVPGTQTYVFHTLADFGDLYSSNAFVSAFGVGNGGGAGASFSALADNVTLTTTAGSRGYNFAATAAVPEPATWALMLMGFGGMGVAMRRQRRNSALAQVA